MNSACGKWEQLRLSIFKCDSSLLWEVDVDTSKMTSGLQRRRNSSKSKRPLKESEEVYKTTISICHKLYLTSAILREKHLFVSSLILPSSPSLGPGSPHAPNSAPNHEHWVPPFSQSASAPSYPFWLHHPQLVNPGLILCVTPSYHSGKSPVLDFLLFFCFWVAL